MGGFQGTLMVDRPVEPGSSGAYPSGMATRLGVLETLAQTTQATLASMQQDIRLSRQAVDRQIGELRRVHDRDFRLTFGAIIASTLGLAALIAHEAHLI